MTDDHEALIGLRVARARERAQRSQQAVGEEMRELGHKWSQATVWSVENGERPLRLAEAVDLAAVLHCTVDDFVLRNWESTLREKVRAVRSERDMVTQWVFMLHVQVHSLRWALDEARKQEVDQPGVIGVMESAEGLLTRDLLADALKSADRQIAAWEDEQEGSSGPVEGEPDGVDQ